MKRIFNIAVISAVLLTLNLPSSNAYSIVDTGGGGGGSLSKTLRDCGFDCMNNWRAAFPGGPVMPFLF